MSRPPTRLACIALLLAISAPWPALAGAGATLQVSVRVVDRCTVAVPPGQQRRAGGQHPVVHACAGDTPAIIRAAPPSAVHGSAPGAPAAAGSGAHVLVTVSY